uniref:Uncharacterized protein n=1 Tax=Chromera velia CCMP2878 TaxID=1169474 RepID=A0A0G4HFY2_9ALVE|eukprot:Cvel_27189.t1-p1 / transcript=Cvel_27189.t1 / gene=Cvel_27189 / organism=Chromera_velia_CCMP2878 / gene_product=hypothetical protein / transcript_product=hypothetical protein / location=Cvel_scaffold3356:1109-3377(+) / protein_length=358 / sequence_SO=supercontig / SO=protein_coding / is_pseudo=false
MSNEDYIGLGNLFFLFVRTAGTAGKLFAAPVDLITFCYNTLKISLDAIQMWSSNNTDFLCPAILLGPKTVADFATQAIKALQRGKWFPESYFKGFAPDGSQGVTQSETAKAILYNAKLIAGVSPRDTSRKWVTDIHHLVDFIEFLQRSQADAVSILKEGSAHLPADSSEVERLHKRVDALNGERGEEGRQRWEGGEGVEGEANDLAEVGQGGVEEVQEEGEKGGDAEEQEEEEQDIAMGEGEVEEGGGLFYSDEDDAEKENEDDTEKENEDDAEKEKELLRQLAEIQKKKKTANKGKEGPGGASKKGGGGLYMVGTQSQGFRRVAPAALAVPNEFSSSLSSFSARSGRPTSMYKAQHY